MAARHGFGRHDTLFLIPVSVLRTHSGLLKPASCDDSHPFCTRQAPITRRNAVRVPLAAVSHYSGVESHGGPEYAGVWYEPALVVVFTRSGIRSWRSVDGFNASGPGALDRRWPRRVHLRGWH